MFSAFAKGTFKFCLTVTLVLSGTCVALAHPGKPIEPHDLWVSWNTGFLLLLTLEVSAFVYVWGIWKVWQRAGLGRGISVRSCIAIAGALLALIVALVSPLDALSGALFSAHMAQHLILMLVVAPLLVMSDFPLVLLWALPRDWAKAAAQGINQANALRSVYRFLTNPLISWFLFAITMWVWHMPALYQLALRDETIHAIEHLGFVLTAMLFWWVLFDKSRPACSRLGLAVPYLFTTALHSGILGALLTFASEPWYPLYLTRGASWGLSLLQDQQFAGVLMWLLGGAVFALLAVLYFKAWLDSIEQRTTALRSGKNS